MSKAEIIAGLTELSAEDRADVTAWLDRYTLATTTATPVALTSSPARLRSPRLAECHRVADFKKQVTELPADTAL